MRNIQLAASVAAVLFALTACNDCSIIEDKGNPIRHFRLLDEEGNNLWFGANAAYDPAEAQFIHETAGTLSPTVNSSLKAVSVILPVTDDPEEEITLMLDSVTTENLRYTTLVYEEECTKMYELSYLFQNETKICTSCGHTDFNDDQFIKLRK